mgnify:CR=1 FL=1
MKVLPATQTMATLSHRTLTLELPRFTWQEVQDARAGRRECEPARILHHEMTHWYDIVGTVWGQSYLDTLFQAYDAALTHRKTLIEAFPHVLAQFDAERAILFPSYFKFVKAGAQPRSGPGTWEMQTTSGVRFRPDGAPNEDDPILFVRFSEHGTEIARQPISVGALLEMRALGAEVAAYGELRKLRPREEGIVEEAIYNRDSVELFYHPDLTTYSAAAHLLSNAFSGFADGTAVMMIGPRLANFALNVTPTQIRRLKPPPELEYVGHRRLRGFRDRADRGFLFGCLCFHMRGLAGAGKNDEEALDALLRKAGLPPSEAMFDAAAEYIRTRRPSQLANAHLRRIREAVQTAGLKILDRRRKPTAMQTADWQKLPSPVIMDHNAETIFAGESVLSEDDGLFLADCSDVLDATTRAALRAVRGFEFQFTDFVY